MKTDEAKHAENDKRGRKLPELGHGQASLVFKVLGEPNFCRQLRSDKLLCKNFSEALTRLTDTEKLAEVLMTIARDEGAVEAFGAIGEAMNKNNRDQLLIDVLILVAKECREGSGEGLEHLGPLISEAQKTISSNRNVEVKKHA